MDRPRPVGLTRPGSPGTTSGPAAAIRAATAAPGPGIGLGSFFAMAGAVGFSFKGILVKLAYAAHPIDPLTLLALRMLYSAPFFLALGLWAARGATPLRRRDWAALSGLGLLGYYISSYFDFLALQYVSASLGRLVLFLYPTLVVLISAVFLGKRVSRRMTWALLASYAGIALVFRHDLAASGSFGALALGGALAFGSATCYATYLVSAQPLIRRAGSVRFTGFAMLAATVGVTSHFLATHPVDALAVPPRVHGIALTMAVLSTVLPTMMTSEAIRRIGADNVAVLGCVGPISTVLFAAWLLGDPLGVTQLAGALLVIAGVVIVTLRR